MLFGNATQVGHQMEQKQTGSTEKKPAPLKRLTANEVARGIELLREATMSIEPDTHTQRSTFNHYVLELYVLRENGYTFKRLAALLKDCGLNLLPSSVRTYYYEMVSERRDECLRYLEEHRQKLNPKR
jgi:hypothetical protein